MAELQCIIVTPEQTVCDMRAEFVAVSLFDGEIGIAPGHSPMIGRLGYGELRITAHNEVTRYYIEGGFVEVVDDVVSVITGRAVRCEELDESVALEQLAAAQSRPATTPDLAAVRDRLVAQSRAQLRLARRDA